MFHTYVFIWSDGTNAYGTEVYSSHRTQKKHVEFVAYFGRCKIYFGLHPGDHNFVLALAYDVISKRPFPASIWCIGSDIQVVVNFNIHPNKLTVFPI